MRVPSPPSPRLRPILPSTQSTAAAAAKVQQVAANALRNTGESLFESAKAELLVAARLQPGIRAWAAPHNAAQKLRREDDGAYLGALGQPIPPIMDIDHVAGVLPGDGQKPTDRVVFINGIATTRGGAAGQMQQVADMTGAEVVGLYNATDGFVRDAVQTIGDRLDVGENKAVSSLKQLILSKIEEGEPLRLAAYSQGAVITSRALQDAKEALLAGGLSRKEAEAKLASVRVETFGGAASHYPDGPQYVHHINRWDPVSVFSFFAFGAKKNELVHPGRGATVHYFSDFSLKSGHSLSTYQKHYAEAA